MEMFYTWKFDLKHIMILKIIKNIDIFSFRVITSHGFKLTRGRPRFSHPWSFPYYLSISRSLPTNLSPNILVHIRFLHPLLCKPFSISPGNMVRLKKLLPRPQRSNFILQFHITEN